MNNDPEVSRQAALIGWQTRKLPLEVRFWGYVTFGSPSECWPWNPPVGVKIRKRRPQFKIKGKRHIAARVSWELSRGPIPKKMLVCHHCDNPQCVNPSHLFIGTALDNIRDCVAKNRRNPSRGEAHIFSKLTAKQVLAIRACKPKNKKERIQLAKRFGISKSHFNGVLSGFQWKWLK